MSTTLGSQVNIVKSTGEHEPFEPEKLLASLRKVGASESIRNQIVTHITAELKEGMSTSQIYQHAFFLLRKFEAHAAIRYSLRRAIIDLGPSGFPFEKFIAEIFRERGFEARTGVIVRGRCIEHEVDVVAWNENKLIMVEAKFHNSTGIKSDAKTALYVRSRFEDLTGPEYDFGGRRRLDEGWLVTNTKFSSSAIEYAKCQNMRLVGWSYPDKGNFQDMIEDSGLHPLTCLASLSNKEKADLLARGIVLAKTLQSDPDLMREMGIPDSRARGVLNELSHLLG